jgi:hypothetical protein
MLDSYYEKKSEKIEEMKKAGLPSDARNIGLQSLSNT